MQPQGGSKILQELVKVQAVGPFTKKNAAEILQRWVAVAVFQRVRKFITVEESDNVIFDTQLESRAHTFLNNDHGWFKFQVFLQMVWNSPDHRMPFSKHVVLYYRIIVEGSVTIDAVVTSSAIYRPPISYYESDAAFYGQLHSAKKIGRPAEEALDTPATKPARPSGGEEETEQTVV